MAKGKKAQKRSKSGKAAKAAAASAKDGGELSGKEYRQALRKCTSSS